MMKHHCEHPDRRSTPFEHRLRQAIQKAAKQDWIASSLTFLAIMGG
jgi:hypothetical protein